MKPLQIGVCTWSLANPDLAKTLDIIRNTLKLKLVHLGFMDDGYKQPGKVIDIVKASGIEASAACLAFPNEDYSSMQQIARTGGYLPDDRFDERYAKSVAVADICVKLGIKLLAMHVGFVPPDRKDPKFAVMVDRVRKVADAFGERGLTVVMETGQEAPEELLEFMEAVGRPNVGINFDPANMILYGVAEPIEAVGLLKDHIVHTHMKDATWAAKPKQEWGEEVVLGTGDADIPRIVSKLRAQGYRGALAIEREAGNQRLADIQEGISLLESLLG
jgi:sugar phosphate isomerase/epimerase